MQHSNKLSVNQPEKQPTSSQARTAFNPVSIQHTYPAEQRKHDIAHLLHERSDVKGGKRGLFGWLDDDDVACRQGWGDLPREHHGWEVPLRRQAQRGDEREREGGGWGGGGRERVKRRAIQRQRERHRQTERGR